MAVITVAFVLAAVIGGSRLAHEGAMRWRDARMWRRVWAYDTATPATLPQDRRRSSPSTRVPLIIRRSPTGPYGLNGSIVHAPSDRGRPSPELLARARAILERDPDAAVDIDALAEEWARRAIVSESRGGVTVTRPDPTRVVHEGGRPRRSSNPAYRSRSGQRIPRGESETYWR